MSDIKLITKDTDLSGLKPLDVDVMILHSPYYVVRIPGYVHTIGGGKGNNDYWAYPRNELPTYENLVQYNCDEYVTYGIKFTPSHYVKNKYDDCEAMTGGTVVITRNGEDFYTVDGRGMYYGIDKARLIISTISEHPLDFNIIDYDKKMIGRKVWYRGIPMVIDQYLQGSACVMLVPENIQDLKVPPEFADEETVDTYYEDNEVKVDVFEDHNVWWFRD